MLDFFKSGIFTIKDAERAGLIKWYPDQFGKKLSV
jgi:hypothetical protein